MARTEEETEVTTTAFRLLTADELGLLKVVELARDRHGSVLWDAPKIVSCWGEPDRSQAITACTVGPSSLLVGRRTGTCELRCPVSGALRATLPPPARVKEDARSVAACALLSEGERVLQVSTGGLVRTHEAGEDGGWGELGAWTAAPNAAAAAVARSGSPHVALAGEGYELRVFDFEAGQESWKAKGSKPNGRTRLMDKAHLTAVDYTPGDKVVTGLACGRVRLYDVGAQKRPVLDVIFSPKHQTRVTAVAPTADGNRVWVANGAGWVEAWDLRMNKFSGGIKGSGASVRSLHLGGEDESLIASTGLDRWMRVHDVASRALKCKIYLKQQQNALAWLPVPAPDEDAAEDGTVAEEEAGSLVDVAGAEDEDEDQQLAEEVVPAKKRKRAKASDASEKKKKNGKSKKKSGA